MYKKKAFTLAEVLLTLTVVGILATLTIPAMIQNTQDTELKVAWKQSFLDLSQASKKLSLDNAGNLSGLFTDNNDFRDHYLPYLSYTKTCNTGTATGLNGCWPLITYELSGGILVNSTFTDLSRVMLNNGTLLGFYLGSSTCTNTETPNNDQCGNIIVDVNGFKGPNKVGKDIFDVSCKAQRIENVRSCFSPAERNP